MKTAEEIKKGLACCMSLECAGDECPYFHAKSCNSENRLDALDYMQQLEEDNAQLNRCIENLTDKLNATNAALVRWIPVEEMLPTKEEAERCHIVRARYDGPQGGYITRYDAMYLPGVSVWLYHNGLDWDVLSVTHWLWIPEIPEPEEVQHAAD